jgi:L-rhamnonate dehydratase
MWRSTQRFGAGGIATVAQSGIDLALWDLKGKLLEQPVYSLLGGPCREKSLCYVTSDDLDWSIELGFKHYKVSNPAHYDMGIEGLNLVEEKIASARETVGDSAELMYNPVMSFNVEFAIRMAERLRPYGLRWLEEPLIPTDLEGHIELRKAINWVPLATGEDHHGRWTFRQLVENRAVDVLQPDLKWCGGLTEALKIYAIGDPCQNHRWLSFGWVLILEYHLKRFARYLECQCRRMVMSNLQTLLDLEWKLKTNGSFHGIIQQCPLH